MINILEAFEIEGKIISKEQMFDETIYRTSNEEIVAFEKYNDDIEETDIECLKTYAELLWGKFHKRINVCVITGPETKINVEPYIIQSPGDFKIKIAPWNLVPINDLKEVIK